MNPREINTLNAEIHLCDCDKFTWAKSNLGLLHINRKNGKHWLLTPANSLLPSKEITSIACMRNGHVYFGTDKGILFWDNYSFLVLDTENTDLPENDIISISKISEKLLLITTKNFGTYEASGESVKLYKVRKVDLSKDL